MAAVATGVLKCTGVAHCIPKGLTIELVQAIAADLSEIADYEQLAVKHGTTSEHVRRAIDYALEAKFLGV